MTKKTYALVKAILTGCEAIAVGVVTFLVPPAQAVPINAAIVIAVKAADEICGKFVKEDTKEVEA